MGSRARVCACVAGEGGDKIADETGPAVMAWRAYETPSSEKTSYDDDDETGAGRTWRTADFTCDTRSGCTPYSSSGYRLWLFSRSETEEFHKKKKKKFKNARLAS